MSGKSKVTVFEAAHRGRQELFIGVTTLPMSSLIARLRLDPPASVPAWTSDRAVEFRSLDFDVDPAEAAELVRRHAGARAGWKTSTLETIIG